MQVGKDLIIPEEMQDVLIGDGKFLLFIALLVLHNEVVEENLVQFIEILFYGYPYPLFCWFLIIMKVKLLPILFLDDGP